MLALKTFNHLFLSKILKMFSLLILIAGSVRSKSVPQAVGDYYWNHYSNQGLRGYANKKYYSIFELAQESVHNIPYVNNFCEFLADSGC